MTGMTTYEQRVYEEGRQARLAGGSIESNPHYIGTSPCFWNAGWHDQDYALGVRVYKGPPRSLKLEAA